MDRFAFKIDAALKANLCKICRLCGIDNPGKVPILLPNEGATIDLDEPCMSQKIYELVGFMVFVDDKMPQTMCSQCVDKINDFYEFREMCYATNKQTRNLLGLKQIEPTRIIDLKPIVKKESQLSGAAAKRGRKRKGDDAWSRSNLSVKPQVKKEPFGWHKKQKLQPSQTPPIVPKTEPEIKEEPSEPESSIKQQSKKGGRKSICSVCGEKFISKELADEHKSLVHVPSIPRYTCNACNQTHHNQSDIRAHQLWHKLSKTPYKCPLCETSVANAYAFTRHLREHTPPTPVQLLVLDRECPLCKKTFITNYFYNTHRCAIRKRKCGGCSRQLNTDAAYMRHAPTCSKIYLNHSKHILPEEVTNEAQMCIKNEVEEELLGLPPATAVPPDFVIDEGMQPVVVLERLSSPLLRASAGVSRLGATKSKNSDRVSAKKYLKRVDQLLKNTINTLVSIKHEPEMHINDTGPSLEQGESEHDDEPHGYGDDFQAANDDSEEEEEETTAAADDVPSVSVKQEPADNAYEKQMEVKQEPLKLKLKITKNHGKLNSSLIDDLDESGQATGRSTKKKKKKKHKEREWEASAGAEPCGTKSEEHPAFNIKQEPIDYTPEVTVMTTIPMIQMESSYNDQHEEDDAEHQEDVKPNRMELDRLMQISHVASGVVMAEEAMPLERAEEATPDEPRWTDLPHEYSASKAISGRSTARKSTGGAQCKTQTPPKHPPLPQIVAVVSGESAVNIMPNACIKPEPLNRGYGDESPEEEINHNIKMDEENAYIGSLDLSNVTVKQEKDLDITEPDALLCNGLEKSNETKGDDDGNEDGVSSADEAEEAVEEDEGERIYREIDLPPLEPQNSAQEALHRLQVESEKKDTQISTALHAEDTPPEVLGVEKPFSLVITNICSQAVSTPAAADTSSKCANQPSVPSDIKCSLDPSISQSNEGPSQAEENDMQSANDIQSSLESTSNLALKLNADPCPILITPVPDAIDMQLDSAENLPSAAMETRPAMDVACSSEERNLLTMTLENDLVGSNLETELQSMTELGSNLDIENHLIANGSPSIEEQIGPRVEEQYTANHTLSAIGNPAVTVEESESLPSENSGPVNLGISIPENRSPPPNEPSEFLEKSAAGNSDSLATVSLNTVNIECNYTCEEEQQNVLNHELSEQQQTSLEDRQLLIHEEQPAVLEVIAPGPSTRPIEETENSINEQQLNLDQAEQRQPRCQHNDDSNINEIAENNNNANIERELQDDALGAQENENP
ncbi:uncharacterized protein LOC108116029 [Drosophila eugracilis]|uniref:uncharacterized protein LOC108116029 n=1 Tax=Drosophila eugracilis TaxID=29029 RepID=UPI001BD9D15F|nr:uncharacterized protein LOC108116029 [Drosophila eugracilis]